MKSIDISAILVGHTEGWMLYPAMNSMLRAIQQAESHHLSVEMIIVLDRSDNITKEFAKANCPPSARVLCIDEGDLAEARNHAISVAAGDYIAFLDGDDLWSGNWLTSAFQSCEGSDQPLICHPEVNIFFGADNFLLFRLGMDEVGYDISFLNYANSWSALSFSRSDIYKAVPYLAADMQNGFGYEDWNWNCETVNAGFIHSIVKGTTHFYRRKTAESLERKTQEFNCLMTPSDLFYIEKS